MKKQRVAFILTSVMFVVAVAVIGTIQSPARFGKHVRWLGPREWGFGESKFDILDRTYHDRKLGPFAVTTSKPKPKVLFEQTRWRASAGTRVGNPRLDMLDDLLARHIRSGMTQVEIKRLLGNPDSVTTDLTPYLLTNELTPAEARRTRSLYIYDLGVEWIDPVSLAVQIDSAGRAGKVWRFGD